MSSGGSSTALSELELLPVLLAAYGVQYDAQKVVGDIENATQVQTGGGGAASSRW